MRAFAEALSPGEADFWNRKLIETFSEASEKNPGETVSKAYARAFEAFQKDKWQLLTNPHARLTPAEYEAMDAGPDLTAIPRVRFGTKKVTKKEAKADKVKKPLNGYQRFVKEQWAKIDDPVAKNRMQILSKRWKEMTQEERDEYKPNE